MRFTLLFSILFVLLFSSCSSKETDSETINKGVNDVLYFFGGQCHYSVGKEYLRDEKNRTYFELTLSNSSNVEKFKDNPWLIASNIAYRFYRNLSDAEKKEYTHIYPAVVFADGKELKFEYSTWELEFVEKRINLVDSTVAIIRDKEFDKLENFLGNSMISSSDKEYLIDQIKINDPQFGYVKKEGYEFVGFKYAALKAGVDILHISGIMVRTKMNNEFSIDLDPYSEKSEILSLEYKFQKPQNTNYLEFYI